MGWQHNPTWRNGVPYPNNTVAQRFHPTNVSGGLSATQHPPVSRDSQRQTAMAQFQQRSHTANASLPAASTRDAQRTAASQQLNQIVRRNNYRGYDNQHDSAQRQMTQQHSAALNSRTQLHHLSQQQRNAAHQQIASSTPQQSQSIRQNRHANVFSGNDSRSPSWQSQQLRGQESRRGQSLKHRATRRRAGAFF
nr:membrane protein [Salmonella sp. NCTC 7297]